MLKQIEPDELMVGMYVARLGCSWLASPFWKKSFLVESTEELNKIRECRIDEVWIDTSKGRDLPAAGRSGAGLAAPADSVPPAAVVPATAAPTPAAAAAAPACLARPRVGTPLLAQAPASIRAEMGRAGKTLDSGKSAVRSMFGEARMGRAVEVGEAMLLVEDIAGSVMRNASALISLARLKTADDYTYMHSVAVCALMIALARELKLDDDQVREAGLAGLLHDVGKIGIRDSVLGKPGALDEDEYIVMKGHPSVGAAILKPVEQLADVVPGVLHHHERFDGRGYPDGLKADEIPLMGRIIGVADAFDAMTSDRVYRPRLSDETALAELRKHSGTQFDSKMVKAFLAAYEKGLVVTMPSTFGQGKP